MKRVITLNVEDEQYDRLIRLAAERQLRLGEAVAISALAREVLDIGMDAVETRQEPQERETQEA